MSAQPTPLADRALAPDLARGLMLLGIAIANAPWYLWGRDRGTVSAHPLSDSPLDEAVQTVQIIAIDGRIYPLFAFLFGYGIWQLTARQLAGGAAPSLPRRLLIRRGLWMLLFGFVHAALLWMGDIIGAYALLSLVIAWLFLYRSNRTLLIWSIAFVGVLAIFAAFSVVGFTFANAFAGSQALGYPEQDAFEAAAFDGIEQPNYLLSIVERIIMWIALTPVQAFGFSVPAAALLGILAARHRMLEAPHEHVRLLVIVAIAGLTFAWATALPQALYRLSASFEGTLDWGFYGLHTVGGVPGGLGYAALIALASVGKQRLGPIRRGITALGRRSMSGYLAQSIVMAPLLAAWGFGLGEHLSSWSIVLVAIGVWLLTVVIAQFGAARRGPAESLLRRLSYPRNG